MTTLSKLILFILIFSNLQAEEVILAEVDGLKVTEEEFKRAFNQNIMFVTDKVVTRESVLDQLIQKKLGIQKAKKSGLQDNPIVKEKMETILFNAQISKDLEKDLGKITINDRDVRNYYKAYPEYRTAHILLRVRAKPAKAELMAALEQTRKIYQQLQKKPEMFGELASRYSQASTAHNGGDMGFQPAVRLAPEYFTAIKGKKPGVIIPPVKTQFGFHIIKILAVKDYKDVNQPLYKKIVYDKKRDLILENYFKGLKKGKKIVVNSQALSKVELARKDQSKP